MIVSGIKQTPGTQNTGTQQFLTCQVNMIKLFSLAQTGNGTFGLVIQESNR
jgi:hypothetical protein